MIDADPDEMAKTAAVDFARRLVEAWQAECGTELLGAYLIGSLAHAGFSRRYSDVDIGLVTETGLSTQALDRMRGGAAELSADWGPKLSVFWTDRNFSLGRFFSVGSHRLSRSCRRSDRARAGAASATYAGRDPALSSRCAFCRLGGKRAALCSL